VCERKREFGVRERERERKEREERVGEELRKGTIVVELQ